MAAISRRTLLSRSALVVALGGGAALGLTKHVHHKVAVPPQPPPAALTALLTTQAELLAQYDSAVAQGIHAPVPLPALHTQISAHGDAIRGLLEAYPGYRLSKRGSITSVTSSTSLGSLVEATTKAASSASKACLAWPATEEHAAQVVPVLGSIAASLSTVQQVLS